MKKCLTTLRSIAVTTVPGGNGSEQALDKSGTASNSLRASQIARNPSQRTLFDFVDETGVETILASFRTSIDHTTSAQDNLQSSTIVFSTTLDSIAGLLETVTAATLLPSGSSHFGRDFSVTSSVSKPIGKKLELSETAATFRAMEDHATEMAHLLGNLVTHYELCIKALRHTEGGSDAMATEVEGPQQSEGAPVIGLGLSLDTNSFDIGSAEQSSRRYSLAAAMPQEEREDMLRVLHNDSSEVSDVVLEILERSASLTSSYSYIQRAVDALTQSYADLQIAASQLAVLAPKLPLYIEAGAIWTRRWEEERVTIEEGLGELEGLRLFYEGCVGAYGALEGEIERRARARREVEKVLEEAMKEVQELNQSKCDVHIYHCICSSESAAPQLLLLSSTSDSNANLGCQTTSRYAKNSNSSMVSFSPQISILSSRNSQSSMRSSRPFPPAHRTSHPQSRPRQRYKLDITTNVSRSPATRKISRRIVFVLSWIVENADMTCQCSLRSSQWSSVPATWHKWRLLHRREEHGRLD